MDYPGEPNVIARVIIRGRDRRVRARKGNVIIEAEVEVVHFESGKRSHKLRYISGL